MTRDLSDPVHVAKAKVDALLKQRAPGVSNGIGITRRGGEPAVKVNLRVPLPSGFELPDRVDGVKVVTELVGPIKALDG